MKKLKKILSMILTVFVAVFLSNPSAASKEVEREFEIEITDLLFLYLSDAANEKLAHDMTTGLRITGYYEPDIKKEGVTQKTTTSFVKRSHGFISLGMLDYRLESHTEVFTKHREADISRAAARKIRFRLPERVEKHFVLRGLQLYFPTSGVEGLENLIFGNANNRNNLNLVWIAPKAAQADAECAHHAYVDTAYYKSKDTEMEIQMKAMLKISMVEENGARLVGAVDPRYCHKPEILDDFSGARIGYHLYRRHQSPNGVTTWPPIQFETNGIYGKAGNVEVLRINSYREGGLNFLDKFRNYSNAISFEMAWIRAGGKIFSTLFSHVGERSFHYDILFPDDSPKRRYRVGDNRPQVVSEDHLLKLVEERLQAAKIFPERKFLEYDRYILSLDRSVFEREFDAYRKIIERGDKENKDRDRYDGFLENGLANDDDGLLRYRNGNIATGKFRAGKLFQGAMIYGKGQEFAHYEGEFENGKPGKGLMTYSNGSLFLGTFREGRPHEGMRVYFDESAFEAGLASGEAPCGENDDASRLMENIKGKIIPIKSVDARFRNGKIEGRGTIEFEGAIAYKGSFREGGIDTGTVSFSYDSRYMEYKNGALVYHDKEASKAFIEGKDRLLRNTTVYCTRQKAGSAPRPQTASPNP
jgi:hypothetical protein